MELYDSKYVYFDWDDKLEGKEGFFADNITYLKEHVNDNKRMEFGKTHKRSSHSEGSFESEEGLCYIFFYYDPHYEYRRAYLEGKQLQFKDSCDNWRDVEGEPIFTRDEYRIKPDCYVVLGDYGLFRTNSSEDKCVVFEGTEDECIKWIKDYEPFEDIMLACKDGKTIQYKDMEGWTDWVLHEIPHDYVFDTWKEWRIKDECEESVPTVPFNSIQELIDAWDEKYPQLKNRPKGTMPLIWIKHKEKNRVYLITSFFFEQMLGYDVSASDCDISLRKLFEDYTFADGTVIGKVMEIKEK